VLNGEAHADATAERVAQHVRLRHAQLVEQRRDVVRQLLVAQRLVGVGGPAVALEVDRDDLAALRETRRDRRVQRGVVEPAVQQHERRGSV
jgi:hypothetical protein